MMLIERISNQYPKSFKYFKDFYTEKYSEEMTFADFEKVNFDFQLGCFLAFFDSINADVQLYSTDNSILENSIEEAFSTYEEYLFLDS